MVSIYNDSELRKPVIGNILFENDTYYIDIEHHNLDIIKSWITEEQISKHIVSFHPRNNIIIIKFQNVVGFVNILGYEFDIRSRKLYDGLNGKEQFKAILDEITAISTQLTFSFKGVSYGRRKSNDTYSFNDLETFDYYYQLVFTYPSNSNLTALLNQCLYHPNSATYSELEKVSTYKSKQVSSHFLSQMSRIATFSKMGASHSLSGSTVCIKTAQKSGKKLFPNEVLNLVSKTTYNTKENQFLKFFLEEINIICLRVLSNIKDSDVQEKAKRLQNKIVRVLQNPFFKPISRLSFLPGSSSVLTRKRGYREIYYHFIQSKLSFRPILEEQKSILHNAKLKNVATLYEIWVFFKIAGKLFSQDLIKISFNGKVLKNGILIETYSWEGRKCKLYYNKTFTRSNSGSYSVALRPDIILQLESGDLILFDAKYKYGTINTEEQDLLLRVVKPEDIHKMHAYLDAIPKAKASIVIYPGTETIFYNRSRVIQSGNLHILQMDGVGAVPLVPNHDQKVFDSLFEITETDLEI